MRKQILLDALTHGFVTIDKIGLLIYDEGWCSFHPPQKYPGCQIYLHCGKKDISDVGRRLTITTLQLTIVSEITQQIVS